MDDYVYSVMVGHSNKQQRYAIAVAYLRKVSCFSSQAFTPMLEARDENYNYILV